MQPYFTFDDLSICVRQCFTSLNVMWYFVMSPDDLQDMLKHNADERRETAVHGLLEKAQPALSPETRVEEEDL